MENTLERLNRFSEYCRQQENAISEHGRRGHALAQRVGEIASRCDTISQRLLALTDELGSHVEVDNQWWRKTINAIIDDIDGLRRLTDDTSALNGPTRPD